MNKILLILFFPGLCFAQKLNDSDIEKLFQKAFSFSESGQYVKGIDLYTEYISLVVEDSAIHAYCNRGYSYYLNNDCNNAISDYTKSLEIIKRTGIDNDFKKYIINNRGLCYEFLNMLDEASIDFLMSSLLDSTFYSAYFNSGRIAQKRGLTDVALQQYSSAIYYNLMYYDDPFGLHEVLLYQAELFRELDLYEEAALNFNFMLKIDSSNVDVHNKLGNTYMANEQFDEAIQVYQSALLLDPDFTDLIYNIGVAHLKSNRFSQAIYYFEKVIEIDDSNPDFYNSLGIAQLFYSKEIKQNIDYCEALKNACVLGDCTYVVKFCK